MGLIQEPLDVDFSIKSKPWTKVELRDFRKLMKSLKAKYNEDEISSKRAKTKK